MTAGQWTSQTSPVITTNRADRSRVGAALLGITVVLAAVTLSLDVRAWVTDASNDNLELGWTSLLPGLAMAVPGALLLGRLPRHAVAWVLTLGGLFWVVDGLAASWLVNATAHSPPLPGQAWRSSCSSAPAPCCCSFSRCCWCSSPTGGCLLGGGAEPPC